MIKYWAIMIGAELEFGVGKKDNVVHPCLYIQSGNIVRTLATFKNIFAAEKFVKVMKMIIEEATDD